MEPNNPADRSADAPTAFTYQPDILSPLISAAIFGYFGFLDGTVRQTTDANTGETVPLWIAFLWSMRLTAFLFALSAVLALGRQPLSTLVGGCAGMAAALLLAALAVWDAMDDKYLLATPGWLLFVLAAWNAYVSKGTLQAGIRGLKAR